jgi:hypothetical protein
MALSSLKKKAAGKMMTRRASKSAAAPAGIDDEMPAFKGVLGATAALVVVNIILLIAHVILYFNTYTWIKNMGGSDKQGGCACSDDWRKQYVLWYPPIAFLTALVTAALGPFNTASFVISFILVTGWIIFVVAAMGYVKYLREVNCTCATSGTGDEMLQAYAYLPIVGWAVSIIFIILVAMFVKRVIKV